MDAVFTNYIYRLLKSTLQPDLNEFKDSWLLAKDPLATCSTKLLHYIYICICIYSYSLDILCRVEKEQAC